jgi:uncharacterized protein (DUF1697 family)
MEGGQRNAYIAVLRGINVSGKNMIKMPLLIKTVERMGLAKVRSYIQSGNLVFNLNAEEFSGVGERITTAIKEDFTCDVPVLVFEAAAFQKARDNNPFLHREGIDPARLHLTFLSAEPNTERVCAIDPEKYAPDTFILIGTIIYVYCPGGYGKTKLTNNFFESKYKVMATTRNWNTVNKLVEMAAEQSALSI